MTIEKLAEMSQRQFREIEEKMVTKDMFKEGMDMVLGEIRGVREDVRGFRVDIAGLEERVEVLEEKTGGRKRVNV